MNDINLRINEIAISEFDGNNSKFATKMETSEANIRNYRSSVVPKVDFIIKLCDKLEISYEWLLSGSGDKLKSDMKSFISNKEDKIHLIPLYDGVMSASKIGTDLSPQSEPVEMVNAGDWFRDATSAMRVHGDSMYPDYVSGSIVAMKEVFNKRLIVYGQDYLIETSEYRILKRLQKSEDKHCWLACSTNQDIWETGVLKGRLIHEPFDIHLDDVVRVCQILGSVKRNHSSKIVNL